MTTEQERLQAVWRQTESARFSEQWAAGGLGLQLIAGSDANDDCAVLEVRGDGVFVIGSDYVRGVKFTMFERGWLSFHDLGWYLAMANFSDVAAMGAKPVGPLTVIRYPRDMEERDFEEVILGISEACRSVGANPLGGDIGSAERLYLSGTAFGICESGRVLRRSGVRAGDRLVLTGPIGTPAAALVYFDHCVPGGSRLSDQLEDELLLSWRRPIARIAEGALLAEFGAHACQDVSDGLRDTIQQLCGAGGLGCQIDAESLPIEPSVLAVADLADVDPIGLALGASVDFELAGALAPDDVEAVREGFEKSGKALHVIGEFREDPSLVLRTNEGSVPLPGTSWDHLTDDPAGTAIKANRRS